MEWFNAVDLTYRADLRDFNELNFARFDAKLEHRLTEFETRVDRRLLELDQKIEHRTLSLRADMVQSIAGLRAEMIKWMFVFWIGTVATFFLARLL